ncbi:hypothetical protein B0H14DRAFT_3155581 [Mycena olivaceomarginata]|nr:hypothetical protein B0H14DRAFT_3155581 [Mycena olivaceomarginata]
MAGPDTSNFNLKGCLSYSYGLPNKLNIQITTVRDVSDLRRIKRMGDVHPLGVCHPTSSRSWKIFKYNLKMAKLSEQAHLLAVLEIHIDKHITFAVREEVNPACGSPPFSRRIGPCNCEVDIGHALTRFRDRYV